MSDVCTQSSGPPWPTLVKAELVRTNVAINAVVVRKPRPKVHP